MNNIFLEVMRKRKGTVMGIDKWEDVKQRVTNNMAKSMFKFKEGPKRKMLKVKYFKHLNIARYLYDRHLAAYGRLLFILHNCFTQKKNWV